jgi:ferredoxin
MRISLDGDVVVERDVSDDLSDQARAAMLSCPERAVQLSDA